MIEGTLASLSESISGRRLSAREATDACLARIDRLDGQLRTFITLDAEGARRAAQALDDELQRGRRRGPLHGIPLAFKDLFHVGGLPSSCGTATREYFAPSEEATVVRRLREAGAITLGTLNMTELAMGPFGDNPHHGDVRNPWRADACAGGSSSGSASAVAAALVAGALGSDTGGSIRLPAACCGIVGLKPTYGRVSRAGAMPLAWSLDHVGPMTRSVRDAALLLGVIAGPDPADATSSRRAVPDYVVALDGGVAGLRLGVPENYYFDRLDPEVEMAVRGAIDQLAGRGMSVKGLRLPDPEPLNGVATVISRCESAVVHARVARERPHELGEVTRARLELGAQISARDYLQALRVRSRLARGFMIDVFAETDVLVVPVIPELPPILADATAGPVAEVVRRMSRFTRFTRPFNGLGVPALAVPCGVSRDGRPLSMQIVGRPFDEATVLRVGHAYEIARGPLRSPDDEFPRG